MSDVRISDSELHAYVDGALEAGRADAVAATHCRRSRAGAARVAAFRADKAMLKRVYGAARRTRRCREEWLALGAQRRRRARISWRLVGAIAAVLLVAWSASSPIAAGSRAGRRNRRRPRWTARRQAGETQNHHRRQATCRSI